MQQQVHTTAQKGAKHPKRFRGKAWTHPTTAVERIKEKEKAKRAEAQRAFLAMFEYVPQEQFEAELDDYKARLEGQGPAETQRPANRDVTRGGLGVPEERRAAAPVPADVANPFR